MATRFITFEGIEGCGKSTQARRLVARLEARGVRVLATREPGGTALADALRALVLAPGTEGLAPETELLVFAAARADHVRRVLAPALASGTHVVCDRFHDSTRAYQGAGRGLPPAVVDAVDAVARGSLVPDVTVLLDLEVEAGLERARARAKAKDGELTRIDAEDIAFHRRVRSGFLRLAGAEPQRIWVVDASGSVDDVSARVDALLRRTLGDLA